VDAALREVYGFDTEGLDDAWRASLGAPPKPAQPQPTLRPTPTHVPTYVPIQGIPLAVTPTPHVVPTSSFSDAPQERTAPPLSLTIALLCFCLVFLLIIGVIVLGFVVRRENAKTEGKNAQG
jgi:hypothetical protein